MELLLGLGAGLFLGSKFKGQISAQVEKAKEALRKLLK